MLTYALRRAGHTVFTATDGATALLHFERNKPSLVMLDGAISEIDALEVCSRMRSASAVPIMFAGASTSEDGIIRALQAGADAYVVKPFSITQFHLRIKALSRRMAPPTTADFEGIIQVGDLSINPEYYALRGNGTDIRLTRLEFRILYCLAANAGKVVVTDKLADFAWQEVGEGDPALLKTHISRIRHKLARAPSGPGVIRSIPGVGYTLDVQPGTSY